MIDAPSCDVLQLAISRPALVLGSDCWNAWSELLLLSRGSVTIKSIGPFVLPHFQTAIHCPPESRGTSTTRRAQLYPCPGLLTTRASLPTPSCLDRLPVRHAFAHVLAADLHSFYILPFTFSRDNRGITSTISSSLLHADLHPSSAFSSSA